jgi:AcrR family transcriptional regulator
MRAQSQARTRTLIVEAATRLFMRDGLGVTS